MLVDTYNANLPVDSIVPDNEWGGYNAFKHLVELGHRQIAIIEGPPKYKTLTDRRWGALRAAEELGVPIPPFYRHPSISSGYPKKGYREMKDLLALPQPPTAVFAVSDRAALGAIDAIKEAGLRVPEDISIVGFDDLANAEYAVPPLTTVHYAREEMGTFALQALLDRIVEQVTSPHPNLCPDRIGSARVDGSLSGLACWPGTTVRADFLQSKAVAQQYRAVVQAIQQDLGTSYSREEKRNVATNPIARVFRSSARSAAVTCCGCRQ